ncbi:hypothetical protein C6P42_002348 [Pichia californica]|nr:hypothetical protein C6P42_002348 [[Candida] californica]
MSSNYVMNILSASSSESSDEEDNSVQNSCDNIFPENHHHNNTINNIKNSINNQEISSSNTGSIPNTTERTPSIHSRDSSFSSLTNLSKKLSINKKNSIPESFNKISSKFKRTNSISSSNLNMNLFTRKPSISMRSNESPNSSIVSVDEYFDFENMNNSNNSLSTNPTIINIPSNGNLKRINSWSNQSHKNNNNNNGSNSTYISTPSSNINTIQSNNNINTNYNIINSKLSPKGNFFNSEIENLKFRSRANSSPQQIIASRKSSISIPNMNLMKKKSLVGTHNNNNINSNNSMTSYNFDSDKQSNQSSNDICDEYFSKNRVESPQDFYFDNLDSFDIDIDNINSLSNKLSLNSNYNNIGDDNCDGVSGSTSMTNPLVPNSHKVGNISNNAGNSELQWQEEVEVERELKKLPISPLEDTIKKYLEVLKPLQTTDEHSKTIDACSNFLKTTGPILQEQLIQYSNSRDSYIEQFWFDSYLNYDSPVVLNLNPFIMIEDDPIPGVCNWINRGSALTCSTLRFINALRNNNLPVDYLKNNQPLDMDQFPRLFGSARVPSNNGCVLQTDKNSKHIIVIVNSQFYWFNVLDDSNNLILNEDEIKLNLKSIIEDSKSIDPKEIAKSSFGILTTENRKIWSNLRNKLNNDKTNREILKIIDSALFCLVLDDIEIGENMDKLSQNFLCGKSILKDGIQIGTCTNRWYDKLQLIITKDGKSGINFEHTGVDGHTVLRFASDIYTDSILRFAKTINKDSPSIWKDNQIITKTVNSIPRKLEWNLTNDISLALRFAETRLSDLINQNEFSTLSYNKYGMERIKKMGMSPDAFIQMSFQLTYYSLYGKVECTYEPAMTKKFLHGRTEAIRTVSEESNEFVTKFLQKDIDAKTKIQLLKNACKKHSERTRDCSNGLGQDRHLYALFCIWKRYFNFDNNSSDNDTSSDDDNSTIDFNNLPETVDSLKDLHEIPSIFADEGWDKLNTTIISTSNCGNPSLKVFGFGPVSENGFGLGYIIKEHRVSICASSKHRQTSRFTSSLETTLDLMEKTFNDATNEDVVKVDNTEIEKLLGGYPSYRVDSHSDSIKSKDNDGTDKKLFTNKEIGRKLRFTEY